MEKKKHERKQKKKNKNENGVGIKKNLPENSSPSPKMYFFKLDFLSMDSFGGN